MGCKPSAQKRSKLSGFSPFFSNQTRETRLTSRINLPSELERKWFGQIFGPLDLFFYVIVWFPLFFEDDLSYLNSSGKRLKGSAMPKGFTNKFIIYCVTSWIIGRDFQWKKKRFRPHLFETCTVGQDRSMKVHSDAFAHISPTHFLADSYSFLLGGRHQEPPPKLWKTISISKQRNNRIGKFLLLGHHG